tara:strand:+ start:6970 stop:7722 length:753 start_codon:yes stop_codon:yes gene_type:complete
MKKDIAISVFKRLIDFLNNYNIPYHLTSGTLLGLVRNADLIECDTDIDICTYIPYIPIIYSLKEQLLNEYQLYFSRYQKGDKLLRVKKNYGAREVYKIQVPNPYRIRYSWRLSINGTNKYEGHEGDENNIKTFRWIDIFGSHWFPLLKEITFKDYNMFIPINSNEYLKTVYINWENPIKRSNFVRPMEALPIYMYTIMYHSKYGKENNNKDYLYIDEFNCNDFLKIEDFFNKYSFLKILMKETLDKLIDE